MKRRLTKEEAAELLGCSTRKIERLARDGKLSCEYETRTSREVATFDEAEVRSLKETEDTPTHRATAPVAETRALTRRAPTKTKAAATPPGVLPPQAANVLRMFGGNAQFDTEAASVSGEELSFDNLIVAADGQVSLHGFRQSRWQAKK